MKTHWRATMTFNNEERHLRAKAKGGLIDLMRTSWTHISDHQCKKLFIGEKVNVTALGVWEVNKAMETEVPCKECENCKFAKYIDDEPNTHCIFCDCMFCLPGA